MTRVSTIRRCAGAVAGSLVIGAPSVAWAQLQLLNQQGSLSATLQSGSLSAPLNPVPFAQDVKTSEALPLTLAVKAASASTLAEGQVDLTSTSSQLRARMYLKAAFSQPADELAKATGGLSATFDVIQRSTLQVTAGSVYGGGNSSVQYTLYTK